MRRVRTPVSGLTWSTARRIRRPALPSSAGCSASALTRAGQDEGTILETARSAGAEVEPIEEALQREETEKEDSRKSFGAFVRYWFSGSRLEIIFTVMTLVCIGCGLVASKLGVGQSRGQHHLRAGLCVRRLLRHPGRTGVDPQARGRCGPAYDSGRAWGGLRGRPLRGSHAAVSLFPSPMSSRTFAIGRTRNAIKALAQMRPQSAHVLRGDRIVETPYC